MADPGRINDEQSLATAFSAQVDRPETNMRWALTAVPQRDEMPSVEEVPSQLAGSPGWYRVTFVLGVPGAAMFTSDVDLTGFADSGSSLLRLPENARHVKVTLAKEAGTDDDRIETLFSANDTGQIARAQLRLDADNFADAEQVAYDVVMPILSWWSFSHDIAVDINGYSIVEEQSATVRVVLGLLGREKPLSGAAYLSKPQYRTVFAAYREGVGATNVFYQVLSFYKVIEGTRDIRHKRRDAALAEGIPYRDPAGERFPSSIGDVPVPDGSGLEYLQPYLGKRFGWVIDHFREVARNAVAHLDPFGTSAILDKFEDFARCEQAVPVLKYIAREMLLNELRADPDTAPFV